MNRTPEQVRAELLRNGISVAQWAASNRFSLPLVFEVLNGKRKCIRGQSHKIAVALGLKSEEAPVEPLRYLDFSPEAAEAGFALLEMPEHMRVACDEAMVREFTGVNHSELAARWKISVQWVYHCLKAAHRKQLETELQARAEAEGAGPAQPGRDSAQSS